MRILEPRRTRAKTLSRQCPAESRNWGIAARALRVQLQEPIGYAQCGRERCVRSEAPLAEYRNGLETATGLASVFADNAASARRTRITISVTA